MPPKPYSKGMQIYGDIIRLCDGEKCKMAPNGKTTLNPSKCLIEVPAHWLVRLWRRHTKSISCLRSSLMPEVTHPGK